jgi:hypothetical protein
MQIVMILKIGVFGLDRKEVGQTAMVGMKYLHKIQGILQDKQQILE